VVCSVGGSPLSTSYFSGSVAQLDCVAFQFGRIGPLTCRQYVLNCGGTRRPRRTPYHQPLRGVRLPPLTLSNEMSVELLWQAPCSPHSRDPIVNCSGAWCHHLYPPSPTLHLVPGVCKFQCAYLCCPWKWSIRNNALLSLLLLWSNN
jgi:hypothetical protein